MTVVRRSVRAAVLITASAAVTLAGAVVSTPSISAASTPGAATASVASHQAAYRGKPTVTVTSHSTTSPVVGGALTLAGKTTGGLGGRRIQLQIQSGSRWLTKVNSTVSKKGTFTLKGKADATGQRNYRAYVPKSGNKPAVASRALTFRVYSWMWLQDMRYVDYRNPWDWEDPANIGTTTYRHNMLLGYSSGAKGYTAYGEWAPQGFCTQFRAVAGAWASSTKTEGAGTYRVSVDGQTRFEQTHVFNDPAVRIATPLSGSTRLRLSFDTLTNTNFRGLFGSPQLLCWRNPAPYN